MSDSDSDGDWESQRYQQYKRGETFATFRVSEEIFDRWNSIPINIKREAAQRMKVCIFWLPILLQPDVSNTCDWAFSAGLNSSTDDEELTLQQISKIEVVERILFDLEMGTLEKESSRHIFSISNMLNLKCCPETLEKAVRFLEKSGGSFVRHNLQLLGDFLICFTTVDFIFSEYAKFIREMGKDLKKTMKALTAQPDDDCLNKSEEMKRVGNEKFQKHLYKDAVKYYSKAIKFYPDNHILYGNRALSYIRCKQYLRAAGDGKRAILIQPLWAKGHYRYCEALFCLEKTQLAFEANSIAKSLCRDDPDGLRDLEQQHQKFISELTELTKTTQSFKGFVTKQPQTAKPGGKSDPSAPKVTQIKMDKKTGVHENAPQQEGKSKDPKTSKSEKGEFSASANKKAKKGDGQPQEVNLEVRKSKADLCKELRVLVQEAHSALSDLRSRNAEQAFSQALRLLETVTPKELGLSTLDVQLLLFGRASALTEIGQPEELAEAEKLLKKMKSYEKRTFQCLVYYAIGRVYLRENRFPVALKQFSNSLQMVKNQITPGKLTWPLTKEIVKETQTDFFKEILEASIEHCKFPPAPDAICRLEKCLCPLKAEIYLTDPDFKGYVQVCCCQSCSVEFHINCWKSLKTTKFFEKNEKDILSSNCLTPDCDGKICSIKIFCPTGLVKCKFETVITRPQTPRKPKESHKCTSLKKLKSKEEQKLRRKQHKQSFQENQTINDEILQQKDDSGPRSQQKAWLLYRDRVLLQISQNLDLLKEEKGLQISVFTSSLKPWLELDLSRGNQIAGRLLNWEQESLETVAQAAELLLERKNRVWARVFIQTLSGCVEISPKLSHWACELNDAGLNAAKSFIERYADQMEYVDLKVLLNFEPLKETLLEKLCALPEFFSRTGLTLPEYLRQAPAHDVRLFIWTLEEHRDNCVFCHSILDEYFDIMDGHFSVLKKSEKENNSPMRGKSRGRKKKQKEPMHIWNGERLVPRDEWGQDFLEDDEPLSFLDPVDPFSVPSHLREQVGDFENLYTGTRSHYRAVLENNPDATKENLYDYFAQILEEHGPLAAEDPLLVGELENFPAVAKQKIEEAGGFEAFLLESLRFIRMKRRIGLAKHAVSLQQGGFRARLDELDEITDADCNSLSPDLYTAGDFTSCLKTQPTEHAETRPILPNPYLFFCQSSENDSLSQSDHRDFDQAFNTLPNGHGELYLDSLDSDVPVTEADSASERFLPTNENSSQRHAAVQTCKEDMKSVLVNTDLYERFEGHQGDINKKEKSNVKLEQWIKKMKNRVKVNANNNDDVLLEEEIKRTVTKIQETHEELSVFQQKLEEEVKKDQKEKKENQEELKALKMEVEQLVKEQTRLSQNIQDKTTGYEAKLRESWELSNQSATEKMSLEEEIKRCKALLASANKRSYTALMSVVDSCRDQSLYGLYRELADAKALMTKLDEALHRNQNQDLEMARNNCRALVEEAEKKISIAEQKFKEQIDQVKNGSRLQELLPVSLGNNPNPLPVAAKESVSQTSAQASHSIPPPAAEAAAAPPHYTSVKQHRKPVQPPSTVFDKAMESLTAMFPAHTRPDLVKYVQEFRMSRGGSLNSMALQDVVGGVTQLILDHQERLNSVRANLVGRSSPARIATPPPQPSAWQPIAPQNVKKTNALNMEDPCIICHEDMDPEDTDVLECRHSFHSECIRSWLKEKSTCPTCRTHALLNDDFPALKARRRKAP